MGIVNSISNIKLIAKSCEGFESTAQKLQETTASYFSILKLSFYYEDPLYPELHFLENNPCLQCVLKRMNEKNL